MKYLIKFDNNNYLFEPEEAFSGNISYFFIKFTNNVNYSNIKIQIDSSEYNCITINNHKKENTKLVDIFHLKEKNTDEYSFKSKSIISYDSYNYIVILNENDEMVSFDYVIMVLTVR